MLYQLLYPLHEVMSALNVFRYITFRSAMAALTAMVISFGLGGFFIRKLRELQWGQEIREEGPAEHRAKQGTPTMGGILIITAVILPVLLWADLKNLFVWIVIFSTLAFGLVGFVDDYLKIHRKQSMGLTTRQKFAAQTVIAVGIGVALVILSKEGLFSTHVSFPFFKAFYPDFGWFYAAFAVLVLVGSANAVNLSDGLDGLAIGSVLISSGTFAILCYVVGHAVVAEYLGIPNMKGAGELTVVCASLVGASLGFLWFNCNPAQIFMGDVGSMALGGAIGTIALLIKQEMLLVLVGGLFVIEALSVIIQVASFKMTGKRIFKMAPIHHHFEKAGWAEPKIVIRFWIVAIIFALISLSTLKLR
jgi:phospho-N-acetylmuramoyl-pentapeptide-transferase